MKNSSNRSSYVTKSFSPARFIGLLTILLVYGCSQPLVRPVQSRDELDAQRAQFDQQREQAREDLINRNLERIKAKHDDFVAGRAPAEPIVDLLIISGGGDWGAFGAGFLKGWGTVTGDLARPHEFDAVTGVSTGALIAPFAFLGDDQSIQQIVDLYRNPQHDWVKPRGLIQFLNGGQSYAEIPGLEEDIDNAISPQILSRLADGGTIGRFLAVNTTNVDMQEMHVFDLTAEAHRAAESGKPDRIRQILLASSALPGAFPPRLIDGVLYVDGGVTSNILYGNRTQEDDDNFISAWLAKYPDVPLPKIRYWVIFNNELRWPPETVQPRWGPILASTSTASTRSATVNSMRLLFAKAEIARLKHHANVEVRIVAVPDGWVPPKPGVFNKETMNALADLGEKMGADPANWQTSPP